MSSLVVTAVCGCHMTMPEFDYKWHYDYIKRIVNSYLRTGESMDDLAHYCMEMVLRNRDQYDPNRMKYSSWVFLVVKDAALRHRQTLDKSNFLTYTGTEIYSQTEICTPEGEYEAKELAHRISHIVDNLPTNQRLVMEMYEYEQIPLYKVADELGLRYGHVRNLYMFAKNTVNKAIKDYFENG